jgi:hypothetical protein
VHHLEEGIRNLVLNTAAVSWSSHFFGGTILPTSDLEETRLEEEIAYRYRMIYQCWLKWQMMPIIYKVVMNVVNKNNAIAITVSIMQINIHCEEIQVACCGLLDKRLPSSNQILNYGVQEQRGQAGVPIYIRFKRAISAGFSLLESEVTKRAMRNYPTPPPVTHTTKRRWVI